MDLDMFMNASDSDILNETYVYIYVFFVSCMDVLRVQL